MSEAAPILAIRPEPGLSATLALGRKMGLDMHGFALSEVRPVKWSLPDLTSFDAILLGSANAIRHGGPNLKQLTHLPVHAVGKATAQEAEAAGFSVERLGKGGLQTVLDAVPPPIHYLRLVGSEYVELLLPAGISFEPLQAYSVIPRELLPEALPVLENGPIVLLHSAAMTRQFAHECNRLGLERGRITLAAMGPRIAEPAGDGWRAIHVSEVPNDTALLEMVRSVCI
ncbi:MAG: uroporphyrinogen-III synthase [Pseudomonadota bacterium]